MGGMTDWTTAIVASFAPLALLVSKSLEGRAADRRERVALHREMVKDCIAGMSADRDTLRLMLGVRLGYEELRKRESVDPTAFQDDWRPLTGRIASGVSMSMYLRFSAARNTVVCYRGYWRARMDYFVGLMNWETTMDDLRALEAAFDRAVALFVDTARQEPPPSPSRWRLRAS